MRSRLDERNDLSGPADLVPVGLLPAQFVELQHRRLNWTPELRLMVAVLDDAIRTYRQCASSSSPGTRRLFCDTVEWFESPNAHSPFAFESICDALGLDPESIRERLRACRIDTPSVVLCDDKPPLGGTSSYYRTLAGAGACLLGLTFASVASLGAVMYQSWAFAHVTYF